MRKQGWLSMSINLFLLVFLISALPLPSGISERLGLTPLFGQGTGTMSGQVGGNIAQEITAIFFLSGEQGNDLQRSHQANKGNYDFGSDDIICSRYEVRGNTKEELQRAITDLQNGNGPLEEKESKRYAAYVFADYSVDYSPYIIGFTSENGKVGVELGATSNVQREIHMHLPRFMSPNPAIKDDCTAEEARLLSHEMEHVKAFRLCSEALQDTLNTTHAIGYGSSFWSAYIAARYVLDETVNYELDDTVQLANSMNKAIDKLTSHGLGIG